MKKLLILIIPILCIFGVSINVKANSDNWFTPDLEDYTFNIPAESENFIFAAHDFETGNFVEFLTRTYDFGVNQDSNGALDFTDIINTLQWIGIYSILDGYGLTPMLRDSLPSYISYNIYNDLDLTEYKGAVNVHVIKYRLDFRGNYSMLLNDYIYDIVFTLEVIYELNIDYFEEFDFSKLIKRGYYIHWYDTTAMEEYKLYTPMDSNTLQFQLINIAVSEGWNAGYDEGYNEGYEQARLGAYAQGHHDGYNEGYDVGYNEGYDLGHDTGYNEGHEVGYDVGYNEGHDVGYSEGYDEGYDIGFEVAVPKMDILLITLIMYIISIIIYFKFNLKWVLVGTILLWFVPIFLVENLFIKIFSVIMIIVTITLTFLGEREEEF